MGLVPTMGALHEGHLSLVRETGTRCDSTIVSIFVNPAQFAPHEDFDSYPRTLEVDLEKLGGAADLVFAPSVAEMYPDGFATRIEMAGPALGLETDFRPHFFAGVATVVAKLLLAALPDAATFGEKDYQQLLVVKRLVRDLGLPVEILGGAIVREADGLAMSSRNAYLSAGERQVAGQLNAVLKDVAARLRAGKICSLARRLRYGCTAERRLRSRGLRRGARRRNPGDRYRCAQDGSRARRRSCRQDAAHRQHGNLILVMTRPDGS